MQLRNARVMLTGATGGLGQQIAGKLAERGARMVLTGRDPAALQDLRQRLGEDAVVAVAGDIGNATDRQTMLAAANQRWQGLDVLINLAGVMSFHAFEDEEPERLETLLRVNLIAPMQLTRLVLPQLLAQKNGRIVNVGSIFGSIGFAYFVAYSASKAGLRGFSEALRRELDGSGVGVTYVAPRAVRTGFNTSEIEKMGQAIGMNVDDPAWVAERILRAVEQDRKDCFLGFPESLFVRINVLLPRLVDGALRKQNRIAGDFVPRRSQ